MTIHDDIYSRLSADATLGPLITEGDSPETFRAYPVLMPQDVTYPAVKFQDVANEPQDNLANGGTLTKDMIQFDCYADTFDGSKALATALNNALTGSDVNFKARRLTRLDLPFENDLELFRVSMDFSIWY